MNNDDERHEEEETYEKVDKRKLRDEPSEDAAEETPAAPPAQDEPEAPQPSEAPEAEAEAAEPPEEGQTLADVGTYAILRFCASLLMQQAWIELGIQAPPGGETKQNLPEAKLAIDTLAFILEQLAPDLDEEEKREMDAAVANLRVNYVQRTAG